MLWWQPHGRDAIVRKATEKRLGTLAGPVLANRTPSSAMRPELANGSPHARYSQETLPRAAAGAWSAQQDDRHRARFLPRSFGDGSQQDRAVGDGRQRRLGDTSPH